MYNSNICHILATVNDEYWDCFLASIVGHVQNAEGTNDMGQSKVSTWMDWPTTVTNNILNFLGETMKTNSTQSTEIANDMEQTTTMMTDGSTPDNSTMTSEGILYNGVLYPYDITAVIENSRQGCRDIFGRIDYLQAAMDAFSIYSEEKTECIIDKITSLQALCVKMYETKNYTLQLRTKYQWCHSSDTHTLPDKQPATDTKSQGFRVVAQGVETSDIRSLQNKLIEERLLAGVVDGGPKDPLLAILGAKGHTGRQITPMVWLGKINQLHYLIDTLYNENVIRCAENNKWCVAAPLFIYARTGKPFTSMQLTKASKINNDDRAAVERCIPATFHRK